MLVEKALEKLHFPCRFSVAQSGEQVLGFLKQQEDTYYPDLIFLDVCMPVRDGFEMLHEVKQNAYLKLIPILVWTSSPQLGVADKAYALGANSFLTKPFSMAELVESLRSLCSYWLKHVELPEGLLKNR